MPATPPPIRQGQPGTMNLLSEEFLSLLRFPADLRGTELTKRSFGVRERCDWLNIKKTVTNIAIPKGDISLFSQSGFYMVV